jgi:Transglutaminase-like superfamily
MTSLTIRSYLLLLSFEWHIVRRNFQKVYKRVQAQAVRPLLRQDVSPELSCRAVNVASALYFKDVQCLQRSATLVCLLRDCGIPASLVLGAQRLPFRGHAWVELGGQVVNDNVSALEKYDVLDRC